MPYPLFIFDSSLNPTGIIDDYEYINWKLKYRQVNNFSLKINRYKTNVELLAEDSIIAFRKGTSWRAGIIESKELSLSEEGKISEIWTISGRGLDGLLAERNALYGISSGNGYDSQTDVGETLMRHYVDVNCISSADANRNYSLLQLEADSARGTIVSYDARFQYLSEILEEISLASGLGWDVILDSTNKKLLFRVLEGLDRSWENGVNSAVIFSPEFGNIKLLGYKKSKINSKNVATVGGQGEAELREIQEVSLNGSSYAGVARREFFIDARDLDLTAKLIQRGNERLVELGIEEVMEFENSNSGPFLFETDFNLGDIVTVKYPDISEMNTRIIEVSEDITPENLISQKLTVGKENPDLISLLKLYQKNINPEIRR